ncbi:Asp23/Gls24 family envelope stress response protein [Thermovenabulum sp.]|uniref:Asp23/Gls24 family envelope stress response protein n=1 Tax=Thermovenabulum sp. TaxID=3100335 RepID=UPI003C7CF202
MIEKIFLGFYSFIIVIISFSAIMYFLDLPFPLLNLWTSFAGMVGNLEFAIIFGLVFLLSLYTLYLSLKIKRVELAQINKSEIGGVSISFKAIEDMVAILMKKYDAVKEIKLYLSVTPEANIPELSADIQKTVKEALQSAAGVEVNNVNVVIKDVFKAAKKA